MRRVLFTLIASLLAVIALSMSSASAPSYAAGTIVTANDLDVVPQLLALKAQTCYREVDGDGAYDGGEPVYLDVIEAVCAVNVKVGDVRLTPFGSYAAGTAVAQSDADFSRPLETDVIGAAYHYRDVSGDGAWSLGDALYLDMDADTVAEPGDLRLTGTGSKAAGTTVGLTDSDHLATLVASPFKDENVYFWDLNGNAAYDVGDVVFLDADKDGIAETGDVYLTAHLATAFGTPVPTDDFLAVPTLIAVASQFCFVDKDGDGTFEQEDSVVLDLVEANCHKGVDANDLRLTPYDRAGSGQPLTIVETGDTDYNHKVGNLTSAALRHHDKDGSLTFTAGDTLYLDVNNDGLVSIGEVRLSPFASFAAGDWVDERDDDGGLALRPFTFTRDEVAFWDADGNGAFTPGEPLYLDQDDDGRIEVNDARLTGLGASVLEPLVPEDVETPPADDEGASDDFNTGTGTDPPADDVTPPATDDDGFQDDAESKDSPAVGWLAPLVLLASAAWLVRRPD